MRAAVVIVVGVARFAFVFRCFVAEAVDVVVALALLCALPARRGIARSPSARRYRSARRRSCRRPGRSRRDCRSYRRSRLSLPSPRHGPPAIRRGSAREWSSATGRECAGWWRRKSSRDGARASRPHRRDGAPPRGRRARLVQRALMREKPLLPPGQINGVELEPLRRVQRHHADASSLSLLRRVHHERDVLEEAPEIREIPPSSAPAPSGFRACRRHRRSDPSATSRCSRIPPARVRRVRCAASSPAARPSARKSLMSERTDCRCLGFSSSVSTSRRAAFPSAGFSRAARDRAYCSGRIPKTALGRVEDALEGEIVGGLRHAPQIRERIADFRALVEARSADDAIGQAQRDEAIFELAHLERRAHENGDGSDLRRAAAIARCPRR